MSELLEQITELLEAPAPDSERLERTLTDGYAGALALEAERGRLEQQLTTVAAELTEVTRKLDRNAAELQELRERLAELRRALAEARS